ncbi:SDR family NAD(P)-dependent oxidoreductase, partial [Flavobacterium psychrophilum]
MIKDKRILITGATSGIGLALCEYLLKEKCKVIAVGRDEDKIKNLKSADFLFVKLDLNDFSEYNSIFDRALN